MLNLEEAKTKVIEMWFPSFGRGWQTPAVFVDAETREEEGIWQFVCQPADPSQVPPENDEWPRHYVLVDGLTGNVQLVGTPGPQIALRNLLHRRPKGS